MGQTSRSFAGTLASIPGYRVVARYDQACHPAPDAGSNVEQTSHSFTGTLAGIPGYRVMARYDVHLPSQ